MNQEQAMITLIFSSFQKQVIFWPDNILRLLERFNVSKNFDFLSGVNIKENINL